MNIITGYTGEPHITSAQDRAAHQGIIGEGSCILNVGNKLAAEVVSANEVRIRDGILSHQGCFGIVEAGTYDTLTIANGTQGMLRHDLIVCRYEKNTGTNVESLSLVVLQGAASASNPADPAYNTGDIQDGDSPVDMPLYRVNIDGITIDSVDILADVPRGLADITADVDELQPCLLKDMLGVASYTASSASWKDLGSLYLPANNSDKTRYYILTVGGTFTNPAAGDLLRCSVFFDGGHQGYCVASAVGNNHSQNIHSALYLAQAAGSGQVNLHLMLSSSAASWTVNRCFLTYELFKEE